LSILLFLVSCKKDSIVKTDYKDVNQWILGQMDTVYYWTDKLPITPDYTLNPDKFFYSLLSKEDRFSFIIENIADLKNMLNSVEKTFGYEIALYRTDYTNLVAQIIYVQVNSPAYNAGLRRGDFFNAINGKTLTIYNYKNLLSITNAITLTIVEYHSNTQIFIKKSDVSLTAVTLDEDPLILDSVYTISGNKIGYLFYKQFVPDPGDNTLKYDQELETVFGNFKQNEISSLILDLRMNTGGALNSATKLASLMVKGLDTSHIFLKNNYNPMLTEMITYFYGKNFFNVKFVNESNNIGNQLNNLIILTGKYTASASEDLINGLKPYMNVYLIGDTTYGKNYGSITISDETNKIKWGLQPIVMKVSNSLDESNFSNGFLPDFLLIDQGPDLKQFGDVSETMLAAAISRITNKTNKSVQINATIKGIQFSEIYNSLSRKTNLPLGISKRQKGNNLR
jgi:carboxyl-terminal processing protease